MRAYIHENLGVGGHYVADFGMYLEEENKPLGFDPCAGTNGIKATSVSE